MAGIWGQVVHVEETLQDRQLLQVCFFDSGEMMRCMHYVFPPQSVPLRVGDEVQINTSAVDLKLGTGGYGIVSGFRFKSDCTAMLTTESESTGKSTAERGCYPPEAYAGHVMKLRYTSQQTPVNVVESPEGGEQHEQFRQPFSLDGKMVFLAELHSVLPVWISLLRCWQPRGRSVYLMDDQAALQASFSHHLQWLRRHGWCTTITYGQARGGDMEAVNIYTALEAAAKVVDADHVLITQGPGVVGTGTKRGFSGMQLANWIHAVYTNGGQPVVIPRMHATDLRERHVGFSHHTMETLLHHTLVETVIPYPCYTHDEQDDEEDAERYEQPGKYSESERYNQYGKHGKDKKHGKVEKHAKYGVSLSVRRKIEEQATLLSERHRIVPVDVRKVRAQLEEAVRTYERKAHPVTTMGRTSSEDPLYFDAVGAALQYYREQGCV
jgi:hypothetical protein